MKKKLLTAILVGVMSVTTLGVSYVADAGQVAKAETNDQFSIDASVFDCHDGKVLVNEPLHFSTFVRGGKGNVQVRYYIADSRFSPRTQIQDGYAITEPGTYTINVAADDSEGNRCGCEFQIEAVAQKFEIKNCKINGSEDRVVSAHKPLYFSIDSDNSRGDATYRYYIADSRFSPRTEIYQGHIINEPGTYTINVAGADTFGDKASYEFEITVK